MDSEEWAKFVVKTREKARDSQEGFADRFQITQQAVSLWEKGQMPRKKAMEQIVAFSEQLKTTPPPPDPPNIGQHHDYRPSIHVPLISWVQAGNFVNPEPPTTPGYAADWLETSATTSKSAFALTVFGDSMNPEFWDGDVIVVDPDRSAENGSYVVAKNGDDATFGTLGSEVQILSSRPLTTHFLGQHFSGVAPISFSPDPIFFHKLHSSIPNINPIPLAVLHFPADAFNIACSCRPEHVSEFQKPRHTEIVSHRKKNLLPAWGKVAPKR